MSPAAVIDGFPGRPDAELNVRVRLLRVLSHTYLPILMCSHNGHSALIVAQAQGLNEQISGVQLY